MIDLCICHSPADSAVASRLAARLERGAEARVWFEELRGGATVADTWENGSASAGVLLLLSPTSVPARADRDSWASLLDHIEANDEPSIASLLLAPCPAPPLVRRKRFFDLGAGEIAAFRAVERWAVGLHAQPDAPSFIAAKLPAFTRDSSIEALWTALVDRSGTVRGISPQTTQEFAREAADHFRDIIWVACANTAMPWILGGIASRINVADPSPAALEAVLRDHRLLVVLDGLRGESPLALPPGARGSLLLTQPNAAPAPDDPIDALHEALSACRHSDAPLSLAARIAGNSDVQRLVDAGAVEPLDATAGRYRVIRPAICDGARARRASVLRDAYRMWHKHAHDCTAWLGEVEPAIRWAAANDWPCAAELGLRAFDFLRHRARIPEAVHLATELQLLAGARDDFKVAAQCAEELSWLEGAAGPRRPPGRVEQLSLFATEAQ